MKWFLWSIVFELGVIGSTVADDLRDIATALESYCFECHDALIAEGEIDLETAVAQRPLVKNLRLWENVIERVRNGEMPPPDGDAPQPSERFRRGFVDALVDEVERFDYETLDDPGYESARRLTHLEFENAVSDLLGMRLDLKEGFPPDLSGESGFDNSANTLFLQPELFDRYVAAVEVAMDTAFPEKAQTQAHAVSRLQVAGTTNFDQWTPSAAREAIGTFARRAFRRPVGAPDVDPYFELLRAGQHRR